MPPFSSRLVISVNNISISDIWNPYNNKCGKFSLLCTKDSVYFLRTSLDGFPEISAKRKLAEKVQVWAVHEAARDQVRDVVVAVAACKQVVPCRHTHACSRARLFILDEEIYYYHIVKNLCRQTFVRFVRPWWERLGMTSADSLAPVSSSSRTSLRAPNNSCRRNKARSQPSSKRHASSRVKQSHDGTYTRTISLIAATHTKKQLPV